jgi:transcription initiation factor TFIID TATA-box-binding protein
MIELASAVGGGKLERELDLNELALDIRAEEVRYNPEDYHGIILRFDTEGPAILIYRSGAFSISGASSLDELYYTFDLFEDLLSNLFGDDIPGYETGFEVRNLVFVEEYESSNPPINLSSLSIHLGMENIEYDPEQFPGIFYRPENSPGLFLIFNTGKLVLTGVDDWDVAEQSFERLCGKLDELYRQSTA